MKVLLGYSHYNSAIDLVTWLEGWANRLKSAGIDIELFCLTIDPPGPRLSWPQLQRHWESGEPKLYFLYEKLLKKVENFDVFINWNGINLHPDFVRLLPIRKVYSCFDDPESSKDLSKPVARYYDLSLVGNIAEVDTYREWGVKNVAYWPLGFFASDFDPSVTEAQIRSNERDVDLTLLCERVSGRRAGRLDKFTNAFPSGEYYGRGWPNGYLEECDKLGMYRRTKIGPNFHNSTGPINFRTFMLPANGVMLLCDNKSHLSKLFRLGEEAIGFNTVEEAIELCDYYLKHDDERKRIAVNGWKRVHKDYNEVDCFKIGLQHIKKLGVQEGRLDVDTQIERLKRIRLMNMLKYRLFFFPLLYFPIRILSGLLKKIRNVRT